VAEQAVEYSKTELGTLARGAVVERFGEELKKVIDNIDDLNFEAKTTRSITVEVKFKPDGSRQAVATFVSFRTKLAAPKQCEAMIFIAHERNGKPIAVDNNYHQPELLKG
jgi:hypothetical protein